jgi:ribosomal protein S27AE
MTKRSTNLNRWRKAGSPEAIADLMQFYGITADELRAYYRKNAGTSRKTTICPRCGKSIEVEVNNFDGSAVCPVCENDITIQIEK